MNQLTTEQLRIQSLEAQIAWLKDKSTRIEFTPAAYSDWYATYGDPEWSEDRYYRIAQPETKDMKKEEVKPMPEPVKLLPCPFCDRDKPEYIINTHKDLVELACRECGVCFSVYIDLKYLDDGKAHLAQRWSRRVTPVVSTDKKADLEKEAGEGSESKDAVSMDVIRRCMDAERDDYRLVLGALDTLGTKLADYNHQWTEGEKEIYEQAVKIIKDMIK